jgi:Immunoglobulin domain
LLIKTFCSDATSTPALEIHPSDSIQAGEEVTVTCMARGGNPEPELSLYLGSERVLATNESSASFTIVANPEQDELEVRCEAQNDVMDSPVEASTQLEVLCKFLKN